MGNAFRTVVHSSLSLLVLLLLFGISPTGSIADELTFGNILVANGDTVYEYTTSGTLVQSFLVPSPEPSDPVMVRDVVAESKTRFHVMTYGGTFMASEQMYLSTHDISQNTWEHNTIAEWSLPSVTNYATLAIDRQFIYCPDGSTFEREKYGTIRFPLNDLSNPTRFHEDEIGDPQWANYNVGLDGMLYANKRGGVFTYSVFDRTTMNVIEGRVTPEHPVNDTVNSFAFDRDGHFYAICAPARNTFIHYDSDGNIVDRVGGVGATDIELARDGTIVCGSGSGTIAITHRSKMNGLTLDDFTFIDVSENDNSDAFAQNFVEIIEDPKCTGATDVGTTGNDDMIVDVTGKTFVGISSLAGHDTITIIGTAEEDLILEVCCGHGNDEVDFRVNASAVIDLGEGRNILTTLNINRKKMTVFSGSSIDTITTGLGDDDIFSRAGSDIINSGPGNDYIECGHGNDVVNAGTGDDIVLGQAGRDTISGSLGNDILDGGPADDILNGNNGSDILLGRGGDDELFGHAHVDFLFGGFGNDKLNAGPENGFLSGGNGNDDLRVSGTGFNSYFGGQGNDALIWSADQDANSRHVPDNRDQKIPVPLWKDEGKSIGSSKFENLVRSAIDRLNAAGIDLPSM